MLLTIGRGLDAYEPTSAEQQVRSTLSVFVKQDINLPAPLWAADVRSGIGKPLLDPNPQFRSMQFGQASVFRWKDESGRPWEGGLILPVGYDPSKRYQICSCKRTFSMKCHHKIIEVVPQIQKAQRKLTLEVELSGVFEVRAATRYRLQYDL
jgi:hypothetical protein